MDLDGWSHERQARKERRKENIGRKEEKREGRISILSSWHKREENGLDGEVR